MYVRNKNKSICSGIYEVAFPSYKDIQYYTKISESNIKKYLDILVDLNLIKYDNAGWEEELSGSIRLFKEKAKEKGLIIIFNREKSNPNSLSVNFGERIVRIDYRAI